MNQLESSLCILISYDIIMLQNIIYELFYK